MHAIPSGADIYDARPVEVHGPAGRPPTTTASSAPHPPTRAATSCHDFLVTHAQPRGWSDVYSLGSCGLCEMHLFYADTTSSSEAVFNGNGWFFHEEDDRDRSYLRIDGRDAVTSQGAADIDVDPGRGRHKGSTLTGVPPVTHTTTRDAGTDMTLVEDQDLVRRDGPAPTWPPSAAACGKWVPTGVHSHHTVRQEREGTLVRIEDVFTSTDGAEHALDLHWDQFFRGPPGAAEPAFRFAVGPGRVRRARRGRHDRPPAGGAVHDLRRRERPGAGRRSPLAARRDRLRPALRLTRVLPFAGVHPPDDRDGPRRRIGHRPARVHARPDAGRGRRDRHSHRGRVASAGRARPPPPGRARAPSPCPVPPPPDVVAPALTRVALDEHHVRRRPRRTAIAARASAAPGCATRSASPRR